MEKYYAVKHFCLNCLGEDPATCQYNPTIPFKWKSPQAGEYMLNDAADENGAFVKRCGSEWNVYALGGRLDTVTRLEDAKKLAERAVLTAWLNRTFPIQKSATSTFADRPISKEWAFYLAGAVKVRTVLDEDSSRYEPRLWTITAYFRTPK